MPDSIRTGGELTPQNQPALGARVVYDIPRTADLENIFINFSGNITLSTGATGIITDGILNLITSVDLLANSGRDVIATIPFAELMQSNMFRRKNGSVPQISQVGYGIANNAFSVSGYLDLAAFGCTRPKDTSLRENNYESLQLAFRFAGDLTGVYYGSYVETVGSRALSLVVAVSECVELQGADGKYSSPVARPLITTQGVNIAGASSKVQFKLTPSQGLRGVALKVTSTANPPVLSDSIVTRVRVNVGKVNRLDKAFATIKAQNNARMPAAIPTGYAFLDFADRHGAEDNLTDVLDLDPSQTNGADSILEFDTNAGCFINVVQYGYTPLAAPKAA